jgi:CRP-like cAMP-binding protein
VTIERQTATPPDLGRADDVCVDQWLDVFSSSALWPPDAGLCQQGEAPETLYLLEDGFVKLLCADSTGEQLIVAVKYAPTLLGVTAAVAGHPNALSVVTGTRCRVRYCSARAFLAALEGSPSRLLAVTRLQCAEIETLVSRLLMMGLSDARTRLVHLLRSFSSPVTDGEGTTHLQLPLKQYEIASFLGITPEHLSRVVGRLARQGIVRQQNGRIVVKDPTRIKA